MKPYPPPHIGCKTPLSNEGKFIETTANLAGVEEYTHARRMVVLCNMEEVNELTKQVFKPSAILFIKFVRKLKLAYNIPRNAYDKYRMFYQN